VQIVKLLFMVDHGKDGLLLMVLDFDMSLPSAF